MLGIESAVAFVEPPGQPDANFVEDDHRQGHQTEGQGIRGGSQHCSGDEDGDDNADGEAEARREREAEAAELAANRSFLKRYFTGLFLYVVFLLFFTAYLVMSHVDANAFYQVDSIKNTFLGYEVGASAAADEVSKDYRDIPHIDDIWEDLEQALK